MWRLLSVACCAGVLRVQSVDQGTVDDFQKAVQESGTAGFPFVSDMQWFRWIPFSSCFSVHYYMHESLLKLPEFRFHRQLGRTIFPLEAADFRLQEAVKDYGLSLVSLDQLLVFIDGRTAHHWLFRNTWGQLNSNTSKVKAEACSKQCHASIVDQVLFLTSSHLVVRSHLCNHWGIALHEIKGILDYNKDLDSVKNQAHLLSSCDQPTGSNNYVGLRLLTSTGVHGAHPVPPGTSYSEKEVCKLRTRVKKHRNFTRLHHDTCSGKNGCPWNWRHCDAFSWTAEPYLALPVGSHSDDLSLLKAIVSFAKGRKPIPTDPWDSLRRGDRLLNDGLCEEALENFADAALRTPPGLEPQEWKSWLYFKRYQAQVCLGVQRPKLGDPGGSSCREQFHQLRNAKLIQDFELLTEESGFRSAKHLDEWRRFFEMKKHFSQADVTKAKRMLLRRYHPDKHQNSECAHELSMWVIAGAELLKHRGNEEL